MKIYLLEIIQTDHQSMRCVVNSIPNTHDICDGQVTISRTKQSGQVWQMRCWISAEKKHFKKSLRTKNLEDAKDKSRKQYYSMMGKVEAD